MSQTSTTGPTSDSETTTRWEGYSDYKSVSNRVAAAIDDAVDAYAYINALHAEDARVSQREAAEARGRIVAATIKLLPELDANTAETTADADETEDDSDREQDIYAEILARWTDTYQGGDGLLDRLDGVRLRKECPDWLRQLAEDIRTAGFEIGYLKAGRTISESDLDPSEEQARSMFEE